MRDLVNETDLRRLTNRMEELVRAGYLDRAEPNGWPRKRFECGGYEFLRVRD